MDEFAEDIPHWPSNIYYVGDVSMYYLAKSVLLLITDTPETNCPASNLYIRTCFPFASQILREVIDHPPIIIFIIVIKMMAFSRYDQHIKAFACLDQLVHDNNGIRRMHIIIDIAMDQ